jgi:hypothetical protein
MPERRASDQRARSPRQSRLPSICGLGTLLSARCLGNTRRALATWTNWVPKRWAKCQRLRVRLQPSVCRAISQRDRQPRAPLVRRVLCTCASDCGVWCSLLNGHLRFPQCHAPPCNRSSATGVSGVAPETRHYCRQRCGGGWQVCTAPPAGCSARDAADDSLGLWMPRKSSTACARHEPLHRACGAHRIAHVQR